MAVLRTLAAGALTVAAAIGVATAHGGPAHGTDLAPGPRLIGHGGRCIDVPGGISADGSGLQTWTCNWTLAQRWAFRRDGTVRALGKCMDAAGGTTYDGTRIQLANCNGSSAQQFVFTPQGILVNLRSQSCVRVRDWNPNPGAALELRACTGAANQRWSMPGWAIGYTIHGG